MREIDDYALQFSMFDMRSDLENSELRKLIFNFDYAYGWLYWITYSLFGFILSKLVPDNINVESLQIIASRELTLVIFLATVALVYWTLKNLKVFKSIFENGYVYLILIFSMFSPGLMRYVESVKPPIISIFLMHIAIYLSFTTLSMKKSKKNISLRIFGASIFFGLATGAKLTIIFSFPVIIVLFIIMRKKININQLKFYPIQVHKIAYLITYFLSTLFAISPAFFVTPQSTFLEVTYRLKVFSSLSAKVQILYDTGFYNFIESIQVLSLGIFPFIFMSILILVKQSKKSKWVTLTIFLLPYGLVLIASYFLVNGIEYIVSYTLGISIIFYISFFVLMSELIPKTNLFKYTLLLILTFMVIFNYSNNLSKLDLHGFYKFNHFVNDFQNKRENGTFMEHTYLQSKYPQSYFVNKITLQDFATPMIWSNFRSGMRVVLVYDDWNSVEKELGSVTQIIILKKNKDYSKFKNNTIISELIKRGQFGSMSCRLDYHGNIYKVYLCK
jgi:hypothetical protein